MMLRPSQIILLLFYILLSNLFISSYEILADDGISSLHEGNRLLQNDSYEEAAPHFWHAILNHAESSRNGEVVYTVQEAFQLLMQCYIKMGKVIDGLLFIAQESLMRGQMDLSLVYIEQVLQLDPNNADAQELKRLVQSSRNENESYESYLTIDGEVQNTQGIIATTNSLLDKSPDSKSEDNLRQAEDFYNEGIHHFNQKNFALAAKYFEKSCILANENLIFGSACANAIFCRANINDWGKNGKTYERDMETISSMTQQEIKAWRVVKPNGDVYWKRATSVHPHMALGYDIDPMLKFYISESYATMDEIHARFDSIKGEVIELPPDLPFDKEEKREDFATDSLDPKFKIRVGFISSGFSSKAVLYLSKDMFRFFNKSKFEIHIFSIGAADNPPFIQNAMRGVDWRKEVKINVDYFHDVQSLKGNHIKLARLIHDEKIHILIEWDGYAREGLRAQGLFALNPAPLQILHQEFLGTTGGNYVDYIITDAITSPQHLDHLYTEKFLYMPDHFFSKGHAVQPLIKKPTYSFEPKQTPYRLSTGTPQENRCLAENMGPKNVTFVYCNFNKFLKNNPETVKSWIQILRKVKDSIICLLENPASGVSNLHEFVSDYASTSGINDGEDLNSRIHFLPWQANPYDHQARQQDFCNVILDSFPYTSHTTAQDALYGGVPIVTRSDGQDMASRVTTSANSVLNLEDLNAVTGVEQYVEIAVKLATDSEYFSSIRQRLIGSCLQNNPKHKYWDMKRYVQNFEQLLAKAWKNYLLGKETHHIYTTDQDIGTDEGYNLASYKLK